MDRSTEKTRAIAGKAELERFARSEREAVISTAPFVCRRVAHWSECDPAGVVYVGAMTEYVLSALHLFRLNLFGKSWLQLTTDLEVDMPAKAVSVVFQGSLWPDDVFDVACYVGEVRRRSFDMLARARRADSGDSVFVGKLAAICIPRDDRTTSVAIPDALIERLSAYSGTHPPPEGVFDFG